MTTSHPDALPDGTLSRSTAKRLDHLASVGKMVLPPLPEYGQIRTTLELHAALRAYATEAVRLNQQKCGCGEPTCVEPWEPGCGLGTSVEHARVAESQPPAGEAVAEVGPGWTLRFVGSTPIAELCRQHPELRIGTKLYTHPAADALGAVRELVGKWCREAEDCNEESESGEAASRELLYCARELEAALAQAPAVRVTDEMVQAASDACCVVINSRTGAKAWFAPETDDDIRKMLEAALGQGKAP